jgi:UDP-N-acetylmuramate dehydrogenase
VLQTFDQDLGALNTLGLRSRAAALVRYDSPGQLAGLAELARRHSRLFVLGGGSNVVLEPRLDSLVIKVESKGIRLQGETEDERIVQAEAGEVWHDFVRQCVASGWPGLENLALIPGTVGAAPVQNIGAYGVELDQRFHSLDAWDMRQQCVVEMKAPDCQFSYRDSFFKRAEAGRWLILRVRFRLPKPWRAVLDYPDLKRHPHLQDAAQTLTAQAVFDAVCDIRRRKLPDPAVLGNAGSFFKNPVVTAACYNALKPSWPELVAYPQEGGRYKLAAGWLVDRAGWKGKRMGPVGVHDRQALVLVNYGGAEARDVALLAGAIKADVMARFGVELEQEPVAVA